MTFEEFKTVKAGDICRISNPKRRDYGAKGRVWFIIDERICLESFGAANGMYDDFDCVNHFVWISFWNLEICH